MKLDGFVRQDCATFGGVEALATLQAGEIPATETPARVAELFAPLRDLAAGEVDRVKIEGIGRIGNDVIARARD